MTMWIFLIFLKAMLEQGFYSNLYIDGDKLKKNKYIIYTQCPKYFLATYAIMQQLILVNLNEHTYQGISMFVIPIHDLNFIVYNV